MKKQLRREIRRKLADMPTDAAAQKSHAACAAMAELEQFRDADAVMLSGPIPNEVDCLPAALAAWRLS